MLANGIAEAMYNTALGLGVSAIAFVVGVFFAVRLYRESKRNLPPLGS